VLFLLLHTTLSNHERVSTPHSQQLSFLIIEQTLT